MRPFEIFFEDQHIGTGMADHALSFHYLCPQCGTIWARVIFNDPTTHGALSVHCPEHDASLLWAPALITYDFRFYKMRWPTAALARDFLYLMEKRDQFISHNLPEISRHDQYQAA